MRSFQTPTTTPTFTSSFLLVATNLGLDASDPHTATYVAHGGAGTLIATIVEWHAAGQDHTGCILDRLLPDADAQVERVAEIGFEGAPAMPGSATAPVLIKLPDIACSLRETLLAYCSLQA
ncbi:hypothetical protein [Sphingomonas sp. 3-13AW]|uniref:hypothetical protein n=1 Tax=Sphingomonas sp. 3-13AW TaxID=3050450 RepID=UPI003BB64B07